MKIIKILTIIFHSLIVIGAGHGIGFLIFCDISSIPALFMNEINFSLSAEYQEKLMFTGLISIIGKIILVFSFFIKKWRNKLLSEVIGILLLWFSVYVLTSGNWNYSSLPEFSFWSSIPFLIISGILVILISWKYYTENLNSQAKMD